jgi:hypothetical protein
MAETLSSLYEQRKRAEKLRSAALRWPASATDTEIADAKKKARAYNEQVKSINIRISALKREETATKTEEKKKKDAQAAGTYIPENAPSGVNSKLMSDIAAAIKQTDPNINLETIFSTGGIGNTLLVYLGPGSKTTKVSTSPDAAKAGIKTTVAGKDNINMTNSVAQSFLTDPKVQSQVTALMAAAGKGTNLVESFAAWQAAVSQAATLYAGGTGLKVTPLDILKMNLNSGAGLAGTRIGVTVNKEDPAVLGELMGNAFYKKTGARVTSEQKAELIAIAQKMIDVGQTTKTITDAKGNTRTFRSPGFSTESAVLKAEQYAKEKAPLDIARQQGLEFFGWMQTANQQRGGR